MKHPYLLSSLVGLSGLAFAGLQVAAPDCEGWYCVGLGEMRAAQQEARPSAVPAGGGQIDGAAAGSSGAEPQILASPVLEDEVEPVAPSSGVTMAEQVPLAETRSAAAFGGVAVQDLTAPADDDEVGTPAGRRMTGQAADAWEALATTALEEPDDALRGAAIRDVGLYRSDEAVGVLLEAAVLDPDPENRLEAVQSLWYSAADGLDRDGSIRIALEQAARDPDERTSEMARNAIEDLHALDESP